ncbi:MAG: tetraacyldisaccharide 4'-kinase [Gemmatimonadales bacterium]|nr:tetraacyldisaccharide 4'-kinase [Gemmatimonadales bacterium]
MKLTRWLWRDHGIAARVTRALLVPPSLLYRAVMALRTAGYRRGVVRSHALPLPAVAVGNLAVGGTGKTPVASWIAGWLAGRGVRPGILLRGYGGDEERVHRLLVPDAIVVADPDRFAGAERARAEGAQVLVLDDAYQRLDVRRDVNMVLIAAESSDDPPWSLPAGPWREGWTALDRADVIVVTRRRAARAAAEALARRLATPQAVVATAYLAVEELAGLHSGRRSTLALVAGRRVVVAAGIADPASLAAQVREAGARVQLMAYQDHHPYPQADVDRLAQAARGADYVVVTEKDAVKLRGRWPTDAPEPLVAQQIVRWETNGEAVTRMLEGLLPQAP